ncbi:MAG: biotin--[acetyl-CoA-carboxylase] ligase, partial [Pseudomonadota bacterium]
MKRETWPAGYARRVLDQVDSTNAEAIRLTRDVAGPTWIMARKQTAAQGRRGRAWVMPEGNFAATLLLHPGGPAD